MPAAAGSARNTSRYRPGATTPSSMHKFKCKCAFSVALKRCTNSTPPLRAACAVLVLAVARCTSLIAIPATRFRQPAPTFKKNAGASVIPPPTATQPLPETHAPPCARPSPPSAVCCSPHTHRAPCTNTPPKSRGRTSHSAPAQNRAPEHRTPNISASHALRMPAQGLPPNLRLHRAHPRAAAPATSPNSAAPLDTPHSALAASADTPLHSATASCAFPGHNSGHAHNQGAS